MKIFIPKPEGIFPIAANAFAELWQKITGENVPVVTAVPEDGDFVSIGSDADNSFVHTLLVEGIMPDLRVTVGSDEYRILSVEERGRNILILAGGNKRAVMYAVYDYFERFCSCSYFWDGDRIPRAAAADLPFAGLDVWDAPRFRYRGLRYFAHRSLTRFQAEQWNFEDWKKELDWCLKKRLDFFMLRIGQDDLFQKTFPDIVPYPDRDAHQPESFERSFNDRDLFWSLEFRGELRKKVMDYAKARGLISPEDCGTMTHWYSATPYAYLNTVDPELVPQASQSYSEKTGLVWDITQDKYLNDYWKLTETHIREYGSGEMFHTIGLAERGCYADKRKNHQMKLYAYRRIQAKLREHYPDAPLLIGTWDFVDRWTHDQVHDLLKELNPENTIVFDYVSDSFDDVNNFTNWNVVGKFPYFFGIFHAYEASNDVRGNYNTIERRLPIAAADPQCKGMVLWPENSHADTLMLEYLAANSWDPAPENIKIDSFIEKFVAKRCPGIPEIADLWRTMLPLIKTHYWRTRTYERWRDLYPDLCFNPILRNMLYQQNPSELENCQYLAGEMAPAIHLATETFRKAAALDFSKLDELSTRDVFDLTRSALLRLVNYTTFVLQDELDLWRKNIGTRSGEELMARIEGLGRLMELFADLLGAHEDYSLYASLLRLSDAAEVNPNFEYTLKGNAEGGWYCRSQIYELFAACYIPEYKAIMESHRAKISADDRSWGKPAYLADRLKEIQENFYAVPLKDLAPDRDALKAKLPQTLTELAELSAFLLK